MSIRPDLSQRRFTAPDLWSAVITVLVVLILGVVFVLPSPSWSGFLDLASVYVCVYRICSLCRNDDGGPVSIGLYAFVLLWLSWPALVQMDSKVFPWADVVDSTYFTRAIALALIAVLAHWFGWNLVGSGGRSREVVAPARYRVGSVTVLLVVLAIPTLLLTGGLAARFASRTEFTNQLESVGVGAGSGTSPLVGLLQILPSAASVVFLCVVVMEWKRGRLGDPPVYLVILTVAGVCAVAIFDNPLSSTRFLALSALMSLGLCVFWLRSKVRRAVFASLLCLGLLFAYPLAAQFKGDGQSAPAQLSELTYATIDFDGFQQSINSLYYVDQFGHSGGIYSLSAVLFWVPRDIWPEKASPSSFDVTASRHYEFRNLSMPLWVELYLDFSYPGLVIGLGLLGSISRYLDSRYSRGELSAASLIAVVFAGAQIGFVRGPLGAQVPFVGALFLVTAVAAVSLPRKSSQCGVMSGEALHTG